MIVRLEEEVCYAEGLRLFREERWFEAHEVLEVVWRETPRGPERELLQGLIQLAVSLEHWRRGNPRGARGQWTKAQGHLADLPPVYGGIALGELLAEFAALWGSLGLEAAVEAQARGVAFECPARAWPAPRAAGAAGVASGPAGLTAPRTQR